MATPGGPRPGNFPPPNSLANQMQNMQIGNPNQQQSSNAGGFGPRPGTTPFGQQPPSFGGSRPGPPPPGVFPRGPGNVQPQNMFPPNMVSNRPTGPPSVSQPPPPFASRPPPPGVLPPNIGGPPALFQSGPPGPRPGPFSSSPLSSGPSTPTQQTNMPGPFSNGPPRFPPVTGGMPRPSGGPPQAVPFSSQQPSQPPQMRPSYGGPIPGVSPSMGQPAPPFSAPLRNGPPPPGPAAPISGGSPYGMQSWPPQPHQAGPAPPNAGQMQPPPMYGMPPPPNAGQMQPPPMYGMPPPPHPNQPMALSQAGQSKIDPNQIPRLVPTSAVVLHETRQGNQANPPPPATSDYIVKDTGNCSPRYIRCTINQIPCTVDLLSTSAMQLALLVQPLALPHPSEEPIQVVDFGENGHVRFSRCKGYINPFVKFIDQGRRFIRNLCGFTDETPRDGRRRDADGRPELCRGTVEFVASKEYMVRDPMPAVFFFLIDLSMNAIQTGALSFLAWGAAEFKNFAIRF